MKKNIATNITKYFGKKVKIERIKKDLSQESLAELAGISRAYLGAVERAESIPSIETAGMLAKGLGIELHKLFIFED
jgi:putative transcriptional regulator